MNHPPRRAVLAAALLLTLAACSREEAPANDVVITNEAVAANDVTADNAIGTMQSFNFADAAGKSVGSVAVSDGASGLTLSVTASGMPAGTHGIHLHEKGLCERPKFESAGKHWNPAGKLHGRDNPEGAHLGDLANLDIDASGAGTASFTIPGAMIASGANMIADADGTALVIHAKADDYKTDPSGNSGDRIACAVLAPPR